MADLGLDLERIASRLSELNATIGDVREQWYIMKAALTKIRDEDYRGPRPESARIAEAALRMVQEIERR